MPNAGIVPVKSLSTTETRLLMPVSALHPIVPVSGILPAVFAGTHGYFRETDHHCCMHDILVASTAIIYTGRVGYIVVHDTQVQCPGARCTGDSCIVFQP